MQEIIAGIFQWRGTYLSKGIDVILDNSSDASFTWDGIAEFLRAHLSRQLPVTAAEKMASDPQTQAPGATPEQQRTLQHVLTVQTHPLIRGVPTSLPSYVPSRNFALALLETLRDGSQASLFDQATHTISCLPEGDLKRTLSLFVQSSGGEIDALRAHLERWFDDAMDRLSGIYARISQYTMLVLGVVLALAMNVDSVRMARTLWLDAPLQDGASVQLVAAATAAASQPNFRPDGVKDALHQIQALPLPIGWSGESAPGGGVGVVSAVCGWLFTAMAVALGAPFWFSLLQQLTNFRNAGPKPDRADDPARRGG
ncbi:MAG: hypothetical protein JO326_06315 [Acetobacteraceae bacterium]|nr:hypothetical protein [Acetobacteraceae bacterium]